MPKKNAGQSKLHWHPAFIEAIQLELEAYRDVLEIFPEFPLTAEPLRIDCVVIKKTSDTLIEKNIAALFRGWNILEYKSPNDYVSVGDFYKAYGCACLYASLESVPIDGITLSFVGSRYPRKLIGHLTKARNYTVEKAGAGIYTVKGDILPMQVIDSSQLPAGENLWLKGLSDKLDAPAFRQITDAIDRQGKAARVAAYVNIIARANTQIMQEVYQMSKKKPTLDQVLEEVGLTAKWEARGEKKIIDLLKSGKPPEEIIRDYQVQVTGNK